MLARPSDGTLWHKIRRHKCCSECGMPNLKLRAVLLFALVLTGCTSADDSAEHHSDAADSDLRRCASDADCVIATNWRMCGSCPSAYSLSELARDSCIAQRRPSDLSQCAMCQGNEDCGLLIYPTAASCETDTDGERRCLVNSEHGDATAGAGP